MSAPSNLSGAAVASTASSDPREHFEYTFFDKLKGSGAAQGARQPPSTWDDFVEKFATPCETYAATSLALKKDCDEYEKPETLAGITCATFRGDYRRRDTVERIFAFVGDLDGTLTAEEIDKRLEGVESFRYSTLNHRAGHERHRVCVLLSKAIEGADDWDRVWPVVNDLFGGALDKNAADASRFSFLPAVIEGREYAFRRHRGEPLDVALLLTAAPAKVPAPAPSGVVLTSAWAAPDDSKHETAANVLGHTWPAKGRHRAQRALAGALLRDGWPEDEAIEFLCDVCRAAGDEDREKRTKTVQDTARAIAEGRNVEGWATVKELVGAPTDTARDLLKPFRITRADISRSEPEAQVSSSEAQEANPLGVIFGGLEEADAPIEYLVDGIIPKASVCMFVAEPYTLKTFAALDVAVSVAHGTPWLGKHATKKGRVVYVNFEMHGSELKRRLRLLGDDGGLVGRVTHPDLSLEHEEFWAALASLRPELVVVDTLSAGNPNVEEKDPRAAEPLRRAAKMANDTNCTFLFVHHTTKDASASKKSRVRGTGAIFGALDVCYFFESVGTSGASAVECIKMRSGPEPAKFVIKLSDSTGLTLDGSTVGRPAGRPSNPVELWDSIRRYIQSNGPDVPEAIARSLKVSDKPVRDEMKIRAKRGDLVLIKRRYHLDGEEQRKARVLAALNAHDKFSTASQVARVASVDTSFVQELERSTLIGKTSYPDGWYVALKTRSTVGSTVEKQPNRPTVEPSNRASAEND